MPIPSREVTIYRMSGTPQVDELLDTLEGTYLFDPEWQFDMPEFPDGATALVFHREFPATPAPWVHDASQLVGPLPDYKTQDAAAVLLLSVDDEIYAIGFGSGFRAVPDRLKDQSFGLSFAIRAVDAKKVRAVVRRTMNGIGRQDSTLVPSGIDIGHIGVNEYAELVRTLAGLVDPAVLRLGGAKPIRVQGSAGLRLRIPLDRAMLVALLRRISEIRAREVPADFAFIEAIRPVRDSAELELLDARLTEGLHGDPGVRLAASVPLELVDRLDDTQSFVIKIGHGTDVMSPRTDLDLADILSRCRAMYTVHPVEALRRGEVRLCADRAGLRVLDRAPADRWLEAAFRQNGRQYLFIDGTWYEGGTEYFTAVHASVAALFKPVPSVILPPWEDAIAEPGYTKTGEPLYNRWVARRSGGDFVNLDTKLVQTEFHGNGFEACDLLGPDNELIHVKAAKSAAPFSHLFNQVLVSTEALVTRSGVLEKFAEIVRTTTSRELPPGYRPRKVILAMMVKTSYDLTPDTLFPFAQVALAHTSRTLKSLGVDVEVIPIARSSAVREEAA